MGCNILYHPINPEADPEKPQSKAGLKAKSGHVEESKTWDKEASFCSDGFKRLTFYEI